MVFAVELGGQLDLYLQDKQSPLVISIQGNATTSLITANVNLSDLRVSAPDAPFRFNSTPFKTDLVREVRILRVVEDSAAGSGCEDGTSWLSVYTL